MREILVVSDDGTFKVEVPDDAKLTYGYFNPTGGGSDDRRGFETGREMRRACLRIYVGKDRQLAAFQNVRSFRDLSLKVTKLVAKVKGEEQWWQDDDGNMERTQKREVEFKELPQQV